MHEVTGGFFCRGKLQGSVFQRKVEPHGVARADFIGRQGENRSRRVQWILRKRF